MATEQNQYHYRDCGLENVFINGGFEEIESPYGSGVAIKDLDGLHRCIAKCLIEKPGLLSGAEFRFLRKELDLSQETIGGLCGGRNERTIRDWESSEEVSDLANTIIRVIYKERYDPSATFEGMSKIIARLQKLDKELFEVRLRATDRGWESNSEDCNRAA